MQLTIVDDYDALGRVAADIVTALLRANPRANIVVPTGETPLGMYRELASRHLRGDVDASHLRVFQLDEYLGLEPDDPRLLYRWMERSFLRPLDIDDTRVIRLESDTPDPHETCSRYDATLAGLGGYDLAILGLGPNGHLGFNEPPSADDAPTRVVDLTEESIESNARYWGGRERVPRRAMTAGMMQLLAARSILLLVSGARKRDILRRIRQGPVTPEVPASYLQRASDVTVLADRAAAGTTRGETHAI